METVVVGGTTNKMSDGKPLPPQLSELARNSSLFSGASFHEHMRKRDSSSRSVLALGQEPRDPGIRRKPRLTYENTFRLEPKKKFEASKVKSIIDEVLETHLGNEDKYDHKAERQLVKTLAEIIKGRVKELNYERYKIVCSVTIGQLKEQGLRMGSRCCWDAKWDTFATGSYKNKTLFAIATVWGVYYE